MTRASDYERAVALIHEGAQLHYETDNDDDSLLRGDQLYAEGLVLLANDGDLDAITQLADVIAAVAQAHAEGDPPRAAAAWVAIGPSSRS